MTEYAAKGTVFDWAGTTISQVTGFSGFGPNHETIDVSDLADTTKQYIAAGLCGISELTLDVNLDPSTTGIHDTLIDASISGVPQALSLSFPDAATVTWSATSYCTNFTPTGSVGGAITGTFTFQPTGTLTIG